MSDSPQGWQYPQMPSYPQGQGMPGAVPPPARPPAMQRTVQLMYAGAALAVITGIVSGLTTQNSMFTFTSGSTTTTTNIHSAAIAGGIIGGVIDGLLWLWMAWKTGAGRGWARVLSTVFFGFSCLGLIGNLVTLAKSHPYLAFTFNLITWGVGLAALIYLWKRESTDFFAYAKQAKLARAYGAVAGYQGYQPPPYGQPQATANPATANRATASLRRTASLATANLATVSPRSMASPRSRVSRVSQVTASRPSPASRPNPARRRRPAGTSSHSGGTSG